MEKRSFLQFSHSLVPVNNSGHFLSPGGTDLCSTQRGDSQGGRPAAAAVIGSPYIQARHGPYGKHPQAKHEDIQEDCGEQHLG